MLASFAKLPATLSSSGLNAYAKLHPLSQKQLKHFGIRALQAYDYAFQEQQNPFIKELYQFLFQSTAFPETNDLPLEYRILANKVRSKFQTL